MSGSESAREREPAPFGVLVMAYGSPPDADSVEDYYTHVRRGRPPTPEQLQDLRARYAAIGGVSRLAESTEAQRLALESAIHAVAGLDTVPVVLGQKHARPFIEDGVSALADTGVDTVIGVVMAPHYSAGSVGTYAQRAAEACEAAGLAWGLVRRWWDLDEWTAFQATALRQALDTAPPVRHVLFTAHSLPERILVGDPYAEELAASAAAVAAAAGLDRWADWGIAWQSAGRTPEPWRGPDILGVLADLAETGRGQHVVVCPQGFTANHLEVAYDIDIEAQRVADQLGLTLSRTNMIEADSATFGALARRVVELAEHTQAGEERTG